MVVELHKRELDEDHPETLKSMHNLAIGYSETGRWTEALELTEQLVELRKNELGEHHPETLASCRVWRFSTPRPGDGLRHWS